MHWDRDLQKGCLSDKNKSNMTAHNPFVTQIWWFTGCTPQCAPELSRSIGGNHKGINMVNTSKLLRATFTVDYLLLMNDANARTMQIFDSVRVVLTTLSPNYK